MSFPGAFEKREKRMLGFCVLIDNRTVFSGEGLLSSGILHCEDYPHEERGWQTVCNMENGTIEIVVPAVKKI